MQRRLRPEISDRGRHGSAPVEKPGKGPVIGEPEDRLEALGERVVWVAERLGERVDEQEALLAVLRCAEPRGQDHLDVVWEYPWKSVMSG